MQLSLFFKEAALFGSIQGLALLAASRIRLPEPAPEPVTAANVLLIFIVVTLVMLAFSRLKPHRSAFAIRAFWLVALMAGANIMLGTFLPRDIAFLFAILIILVYAKAATVEFHNFMLVLCLPGIGALLGKHIPPQSAVFLLLVLSIYDVIAVYWTGHMVELAKRFISGGVIPGIVVFAGPRKPGTLWVTDVMPGKEAAILGTGDLVLPSVLAASAWSFVAPGSGAITAAGALIGLFVTHLLFFGQKERRPMPALPPIAAGAIAGFLFSLFVI